MPTSHDVTRRTLLRGAAFGTLALASGIDRVFGQIAPAPPNIVFIMADDLGYADVSCYGRPDLQTPNIDRVATHGVRFLQGYANSAVCSATRTALITGRYQYRLRLGLEEPLGGGTTVGLPAEHPTLPSLLKRVGYGTTLIGKWHLGNLPNFGPLKSGYDHFYGFRGGSLDYYRHTPGGGPREDLWDEDVQVHQVGYLTDLLGSRAVDTISGYAKARQPFPRPVRRVEVQAQEEATRATSPGMSSPTTSALSERAARRTTARASHCRTRAYQSLTSPLKPSNGAWRRRIPTRREAGCSGPRWVVKYYLGVIPRGDAGKTVR